MKIKAQLIQNWSADCNKIYKILEDYDELSKMPPEHRKILMSKYDIVT